MIPLSATCLVLPVVVVDLINLTEPGEGCKVRGACYLLLLLPQVHIFFSASFFFRQTPLPVFMTYEFSWL
jgi:hypothetical protein